MNNAEMKDMLTNVMNGLPKDMRLPTYATEDIVNKFMKEVSKPLQDIVTNVVQRTNEKGEITTLDQQRFTSELMNLMVPYMRKVAEDTSSDRI